MKKVTLTFVLFISFFLTNNIYSKSHYCIQISAVPINEITSLWKDKQVASYIRRTDNCIMDKRQGGRFYGICCGYFLSYKSSLKELKNVKKFFPKAFPRTFNINEAEKIEISTNEKHLPKHKKPIISKIHNIKKVEKKIKTEKVSPSNRVKSQLKQNPVKEEHYKDIFEDYVNRNIINGKLNSKFLTFSLRKFLEKYIANSNNFKINKLDSEIYKINPNIENDRYNPNVYFSIGATARKTYNVGNATNYANMNSLAAINLDWHLYDAQKTYFNNERRAIFKRLSELNLLASKDRTILNGLSVYMDLWYLQKIIDKYNFLLSQQEKVTKMIKVRALRGGSSYIYAPIDSQNDLYNLELSVSDIKESYIHQEYLFRQSLNLASKKSIYLYDPVYNDLNMSLKQMQKEAIANNRELAKLQEQYKLSKSDLVIEAARRGWQLDLSSYAGYGYSTELEGTKNSGDGIEWQIGLKATYPLSQRKDITYQVERKKRLTKQALIRVVDKMRTLVLSVNKLYNSVKKLKYKSDIYAMQNKILRRRLNISYNRFMRGEGSYKDYSDTLKVLTDNLRQKLINETMLHAATLQLYIIVGKNLY